MVEYRAEGAFKWHSATDDNIRGTTYMVKGLDADTVYEFRVAAQNKAGVGPFSENTMPIKAEERISEYSLLNFSIINRCSRVIYINDEFGAKSQHEKHL